LSDILEDLLDSIDRAVAALKSKSNALAGGDVENLLRVKRILTGIDPDEIAALLDDGEEE
jgi:hypothetical protein